MCFLPFGTCLCPWKYTRAEVDKDAHGSYLIAKAWNSRVLLEWLNDAALAAATRDLPQAAETCFEVNDCGIWGLRLAFAPFTPACHSSVPSTAMYFGSRTIFWYQQR